MDRPHSPRDDRMDASDVHGEAAAKTGLGWTEVGFGTQTNASPYFSWPGMGGPGGLGKTKSLYRREETPACIHMQHMYAVLLFPRNDLQKDAPSTRATQTTPYFPGLYWPGRGHLAGPKMALTRDSLWRCRPIAPFNAAFPQFSSSLGQSGVNFVTFSNIARASASDPIL